MHPTGPAAARAPDAGDRPPRWPVALIVALGVLLRLPALGMGFFADDYLHQLALRGDLPLAPWALFDFGGVADWQDLDGVGTLPWWTSPDWKVRFFRPLASLSLWLDHALFGSRAAGYHATSLALYAALLVVAYLLYRALGLPRRSALGALALLAASNESVVPVAWIANRNTLLALLFTTAAVWAITRHARWGRGRAAAAALGLAALAVLSKESGVAAFALVAAWLLAERRAATDARFRRWAAGTAAAALALATLHVAALAAAGFGTRSLFYATPWAEPVRYAERLGILASAGGLSLVSPVMSDLVTFAPSMLGAYVAAATPIVLLVALWTWRSLRGVPAAGFLALWTCVTILPEGAAAVSDRLLFGASVGSSGLLALLLGRALRAGRSRLHPARVAGWLLVLSAGVLSALATPVVVAGLAAHAARTRETILAADVGPRALGRREVILLQADDSFVPFTMHTTWGLESDDHDLRIHAIQAGRRGLRWTREDGRTCILESTGRPFLDEPFEYVYRSRPWSAEEKRWDAGLFTVEALEAGSAGPRRIRLRFAEPLDAPRLRFLVPRDGRLVAIAPPGVGETIVLAEARPAALQPRGSGQ